MFYLLILLILIALPGILLGLAVRLPPLLRLARSSPRKRIAVVAFAGLLSWLLAFEVWLGVYMVLAYVIFNGIDQNTPPALRNFNNPTAVEIELWLRQFNLWGKLGDVCFTANLAACKVADAVFNSPHENPTYGVLIELAILALVGALITLGVGWRFTRAKSVRQ